MEAHIMGSELKEPKGVQITLAGKNYNLVMDLNAIADIEDKYGDANDGLNKILLEGKVSDMRFLLAAMLRHDDDDMTERKAGKLITTDNYQEILDALGGAMSASSPDSDEPKNLTAPEEV